jgi:hypothetical protein
LNQNVISTNKKDTRLVNYIWLFYFIQTINIAIKIIFPINDNLWVLISNGFMFVLLVFLILNIGLVLKKNLLPFILIELFFLLLFILSYISGNSDLEILKEFSLWTLAVSIPLAFFYFSIDNKTIFTKLSIKYSRVILILSIFSFFLMDDENLYVISLSYSMLLPLMIILFCSQKSQMKFDTIIVIISVLTLIMFGARGPLVGLLYAIIIRFINSKNRINTMLLTKYFSVLLVVFIYVIYFESINSHIIELLDKYGIYARTFRKLLSGNIYDTTGRDVLWEYYIDLIGEKPILGWGIGGGWISRGDGPHNGIIDIYLAHGLLVGTILSSLFIYMIFLPFFSMKFRSNVIYVSYAAVNIPLLYSAGDIWIKFNLFIFVAVFIYTKNTKKEDIDLSIKNHEINKTIIKN